MSFTIQRGTNISEWLSQSSRRGFERLNFFTETDVRLIASFSFDHIRLPIDEEQMWDEHGSPDEEAWGLLNAALDWAEATGLRVIVDLHLLRTHHFISAVTPKLFTDPAETARFAGLWQQISERLRRRSIDQLAYELLNEAVASDPADWNRVSSAAYAAIRALEPSRTIVLGSNYFNQTHTFDVLDIPDDPYTILTFHYYRPMLITHYQATWWEGGFWAGPVRYPGQPISDQDLSFLNPRFISEKVPQWSNEVWDRDRIRQDFELPIAVARRHKLPLYCGEWGAYVTTPTTYRLAWYRDMLSLFDEFQIANANWDYKGGFAPVVRAGKPTEIVDVLTGK
jgi:endoglucanase